MGESFDESVRKRGSGSCIDVKGKGRWRENDSEFVSDLIAVLGAWNCLMWELELVCRELELLGMSDGRRCRVRRDELRRLIVVLRADGVAFEESG